MVNKKHILVTGANSQLARCLRDLAADFPSLSFDFKSKQQLDITDKTAVLRYFEATSTNYCINCAAYTAVDKAENEPDLAFEINAEGVKNIAEASKKNEVVLIHISTDFVFDGDSKTPYKETDTTNPLNVYGASKLKGEAYIQERLDIYFIIRTSWLYSEYGHNFVKTMLSLADTKDELSIVADQVGSPTYAKDLASCLLQIISSNTKNFGLYHYSNGGQTSWHGFAEEVFRVTNKKINLLKTTSEAFKTNAARPSFSVLDTVKLQKTFHITIPKWQDSLRIMLARMSY